MLKILLIFEYFLLWVSSSYILQISVKENIEQSENGFHFDMVERIKNIKLLYVM